MQRMRASRSGHLQFWRQRRLALTADAYRWAIMQRLTIIVLLGITCLAGCSKAPGRIRYLKNTTGFLERYMTNDVAGAEVALLEWETYTRQCQKAGTKGIRFDDEFALIYGRLSLVSERLGKKEAGQEYFQKCISLWEKADGGRQRAGNPRTPEEIRKWFEESDWPAKWKKSK
jgi:hypothetical protein